MSDKNAGFYQTQAPITMVFPQLIEPKPFMKNGKPIGEAKYGLQALIPADSPDLAGIKQAIVEAIRRKWPRAAIVRKDANNPMGFLFPLTSGDEMADKRLAKRRMVDPSAQDDSQYMRGTFVLKARSKFQPTLSIVRNGAVVDLDPEGVKAMASQFYPGSQALCVFKFEPYEGSDDNGVTAYLQHVLTLNKGTRIGGAPSGQQSFGSVVGHYVQADPLAGGSPFGDDVQF